MENTQETRETIGEIRLNVQGNGGETYKELPIVGFLSHLVTSFQVISYIPGFTRE